MTAFRAEAGCWFFIDARFIIRHSNRKRFSNKSGFRPVILAVPLIPATPSVLYARSTQHRSHSSARVSHKRHNHQFTNPSCRVNKDGWVVLAVPVTAREKHLNSGTFSCREPEATGLTKAIRARLTI